MTGYYLGRICHHYVFIENRDGVIINTLFAESSNQELEYMERFLKKAIKTNKGIEINIKNITPKLQKVINQYKMLNAFS